MVSGSVTDQNVGCLEIAVREAAAMELTYETRNFVQRLAQRRLLGGGFAVGQVGNESLQFDGIVDLFGKEIAFVMKPAAPAVQHGERSGSGQTALTQSLTVDPRPQCRGASQQRLPRLS